MPRPRILTNRDFEIFLELEMADSNRDLLRCIAEAIAHLEAKDLAIYRQGKK